MRLKFRDCAMKRTISVLVATVAAGPASLLAQGTTPAGDAKTSSLAESGNVVVSGRSVPYAIHRLPVSSFPELPSQIADALNQRGCTIPQTYEAHKPENVIHGSLEKAGSNDWAILCSAGGTVSLLVFFASSPDRPAVLAAAPETTRLQARGAHLPYGFNWGIDSASPENIHEAQSSMGHRPLPPDHDALADSVIDRSTVYHFYAKDQWTLLNMPD
jgi:hypothetical protein